METCTGSVIMIKNILLIAALILVGCGSDHDQMPKDLDPLNTGLADDQVLNEDLIGFEEVFEFIINDHCIMCHRNYAQESKVIEKSEKIINRINGFGPGALMPQGGPKLDDELIFLFEEWVKQKSF